MPRAKTFKKKSSKKKSWKRFFILSLGALLAGWTTLTVVPVLLFKALNPPTTPLMWIRWQEDDFRKNHPLILRSWKPLKEISTHLLRAVIAGEDQNFFVHNGIDWIAAEAAFKHNLTSQRKLGASTITMQTARNVFLWQSRTWLRKTLEIYFTWLIEWAWGKQRILEVYLNVIEWGDGVFGCEQAAMKYFHRPAKTLSSTEAARMVSILPSPRKWSLENPGPTTADHQNTILKWMKFISLPKIQ